jgi:ankyrin repeat protein
MQSVLWPVIHSACRGEADLPLLQSRIRIGDDVNASSWLGQRPLHIASASGNTEAVRELVRAGAEASPSDDHGSTPLHLAVFHGHKDTCFVLLEAAGILVDAVDRLGNTPLHIAAEKGFEAITKLLVQKGARVSAKDAHKGHTAMHKAAAGNKVGCLMVLIREAREGLHDRTMGGMTPLMVAAEAGAVEAVHALIKARADVQTRDNCRATALHYAARGRKVLERGGEAAATAAAEALTSPTSPAAIVTALLLDANASVSAVSLGASAGETGTPLHWAAASGRVAVADMLLNCGAEPSSAEGHGGFTPLHVAAASGNKEMAAFLLSRGADPTATDLKGRQPPECGDKYGPALWMYELLVSMGWSAKAGTAMVGKRVNSSTMISSPPSPSSSLDENDNWDNRGGDDSDTSRLLLELNVQNERLRQENLRLRKEARRRSRSPGRSGGDHQGRTPPSHHHHHHQQQQPLRNHHHLPQDGRGGDHAAGYSLFSTPPQASRTQQGLSFSPVVKERVFDRDAPPGYAKMFD